MTTYNSANVPYIKYTAGNSTTSKHNTRILNPAYNGTERDRNYSAAGRLRFTQVLEVWMYGGLHMLAAVRFPLKEVFRLIQVSLHYKVVRNF